MALKLMLKPEAQIRVAKSLNYTGDMRKFPEFLASSPAGQMKLARFKKAAEGMVIQAAEGTLIKVPGKKTWYIKEAGKPPIDTGRRRKSDANKALSAFETITSSSGTATGEVVREGKQWSAVIQNADGTKSTVPTGKTNANLAKGMISKFPSGQPAAPEEPIIAPGEGGSGTPPIDGGGGDAVPPSGGDVNIPPPPPPPPSGGIGQAMTDRAYSPTLPTGAKQEATKIEVTDDQLIKEGTGQLGTPTTATTTDAVATKAADPTPATTATYDATTTAGTLPQATATQGEIKPEAVIDPREQTDTVLSDMEAAQTTGTTVQGANEGVGGLPTRELQTGETVEGSAVDQAQVQEAFGSGEVKAASVQDELGSLLSQFEGGNNPAWAAGSMRRANAELARRGLNASSMAGQAIIQAMMESALPIAQMDASNKQQMALMKAEQRAKFLQMDFDQEFQSRVINANKISDIANMNFTAEQQVALENARLAQTADLANLTNRQSLIMAEAAQKSQLELTSLNNRQQAEVLNAQNFLAMDMKNMDFKQQTELFNTQNAVQALFNDQAAENAAKQFNATSENQTNQFFAGLKNQVEMQFAAAKTAVSQQNAGEANATSRFNAQVQNGRDQFNAQNEMVIAQSNVQWRRAVATGDTAAINRANELNASALLQMSSQAFQNLWQEHADTMERSWSSAEKAQDRLNNLAAISMQGEIDMLMNDKKTKSNNLGLIGNLIGTILTL